MMIKRRQLFSYLWLLFTCVIALSGCGITPTPSLDSQVTLQLSGFPHDRASYYMVIQSVAHGQIIEQYQFSDLKSTEPFQKNLHIDSNTEYIEVFLSSASNAAPDFLYIFKYSPAQTVYKTAYWLDYMSYNNDVIEYGISAQFVKTVDKNFTENLDCSEARYYLYKIPDMRGETFNLTLEATSGSIIYRYGDSLDTLKEGEYAAIGGKHQELVTNYQGADLYILCKPGNYRETTQATLTLHTVNTLPVARAIYELIDSPGSDLAFGLDTANHLYYIDPVHKSITKEFTLNVTGLLSGQYAERERKIYFVNSSSGRLGVWDIVTEAYTEHTFSPNATGVDLAIAPDNRRIYVASSLGLHILNMDTYQPISTVANLQNCLLAYNETSRKLYTLAKKSDATFGRYSVATDQPTLEENALIKEYVRDMVLSPDGKRLAVLAGMENILAFDSANLRKAPGFWNIGGIPEVATFSPDSTLLYTMNGFEDAIFVMNAVDYSLEQEIPFPQPTSGYALLAKTDGSVLLAYSKQALYFLPLN